jgi:hypothetical protein
MIGHRESREYGVVVAGPRAVDGLIEYPPALRDIEAGSVDAATDEHVIDSAAELQ